MLCLRYSNPLRSLAFREIFVLSQQSKENGSSTRLTTALAEAQSIIEAAEKRAKELISDAEKNFERAREQGYEEGFQEGLSQATKQSIRLIEESTAVADTLAQEAAQLAVAISGSVINEELKLDPGIVKSIAITAIQESVIGDAVTIVVNPEDQAVLKDSIMQLRQIAGGAGVTVETDESFSRGSCLVRTDFGEIDARIESLLESVRERLGLANDEA